MFVDSALTRTLNAPVESAYERTRTDPKIYYQPTEPKRSDMQALHRIILEVMPGCKSWFLDGKDSEGKTVSNPNIGYGCHTMKICRRNDQRVLSNWFERKQNRDLCLYHGYRR